jgi:hydrogenase maturation factor
MSLVSGRVVSVPAGGEPLSGTVSVGGAIVRVNLELVPGVRPGDEVLVESGVAIGRADMQRTDEENGHVPGHSR